MPEPFAMPRVKVCGLTRADDVQSAAAAGADAVGFVHHAPSPRSIEAEAAAELARLVPPGTLAVAVMVDPTPEAARAWLARAGVRALQLCGAEQPEAWRGFEHPILRRVAVGAGAERELERWADVAAGFVLDHPDGPGGTGRGVDWELAARLARAAPCLLAGGLDETNVAAAIRGVRPAGVDASSRLEERPGAKAPERVRAFVTRALAALEEVHA